MKDAGGPLHPSSLPGGEGRCHGAGKQQSPLPSDGSVSAKGHKDISVVSSMC